VVWWIWIWAWTTPWCSPIITSLKSKSSNRWKCSSSNSWVFARIIGAHRC
jgi:hypothetical protein